jgi:CBS domain-containing protein/sporulation protein YlmC with PRC-barrel domain
MNCAPENISAPAAGYEPFQLLFFSQLLGRRIRHDQTNAKNGRITDLVFRLTEPYPELVGIYIEHGRGLPTELVPWDKIVRIEEDAIFITPAEPDLPYPTFVDQPGWILLNEHLMGQTILDTDGRRTEVVNDVHLLFSKGRMILVHVDISFNGFLRKWGLARFMAGKDQLISWRYVQPLSVEDHTKDVVTLSVARERALELPGEDLADALEVLSGDEQQAMFAALDADKAAEVLVEAEPRAKRQLIVFLREERARAVLAKLSVPQIADLLSDLSHQKATEMMKLLPAERAARVHSLMTDADVPASTMMSDRFLAFSRETPAGRVLEQLRSTPCDRRNIAYLFIVAEEQNLLTGVVDLRDLVTAPPEATLGDLMISPVVTVERDALRGDLRAMFAKYQFRMLPVVDAQDHLLGVVRYKDLMKDAKFKFET